MKIKAEKDSVEIRLNNALFFIKKQKQKNCPLPCFRRTCMSEAGYSEKLVYMAQY